MIGTYLNLDLPVLGDTVASAVAKTATALGQLRDSIADRATPSALTVNQQLDFQGNWATNITGLVLADGTAPTSPGTMYYHSGEFYLIDSTGTIQVTSAGSLNSAAFGGIGGDYGGSNPALESYNNSTSQYRFYVNGVTHTWADLAANGVILEGSAGTTRLLCDSSVNTAQDVKFGLFGSTANPTMVAWDGSKFKQYNDSTDRLNTGVKCHGAVQTDNGDFHFTGATRTKDVTLVTVASDQTHATSSQFLGGSDGTMNAWTYKSQVLPVTVGDRIQQIAIYVTQDDSIQYSLVSKAVSNGTESVIQTFTAGGTGLKTGTLTSPPTVDSTNHWIIKVTGSNNGTGTFSQLLVIFDHP